MLAYLTSWEEMCPAPSHRPRSQNQLNIFHICPLELWRDTGSNQQLLRAFHLLLWSLRSASSLAGLLLQHRVAAAILGCVNTKRKQKTNPPYVSPSRVKTLPRSILPSHWLGLHHMSVSEPITGTMHRIAGRTQPLAVKGPPAFFMTPHNVHDCIWPSWDTTSRLHITKSLVLMLSFTQPTYHGDW